jgi:hypothetical protein
MKHTKTDFVQKQQNCMPGNQLDSDQDFMVEMDVRRNLILTFLNYTEFEPGDKVLIVMNDWIAEVIGEYKKSIKKPITKRISK